MIRKLLLTTILILAFAVPGWGASYYMREDGEAVDKEAATGPGSTQANCMNVAVHNGETFSGDDIIYLCDDGGTFDSSIVPPSSGSSGNEITYEVESGDTVTVDMGAAGHAFDINGPDYIILDGKDSLTLTDTDTGAWGAGLRNTDGSTNNLVKNFTCNDNNNGVWSQGDDLTVENVTIHNIDDNGIYSDGERLIVQDCTIYDVDNGGSTGDGIQISGGDNIIIRRNTITYDSDSKQAIVFAPVGNGTIEYNKIIQSHADGDTIILDRGSEAIIVRYNHIDSTVDNAGDGIYVSENVAANDLVEVYGNIVTGQFKRGIKCEDTSTSVVYNNSIYGPDRGIVIIDTATATVKNNAVEIGTDDGVYSIELGASANYTGDHNIFYDEDGVLTGTFYDGSSAHDNIEDWRTATSQDANSDDVDPLFTNVGGDDLTLQSNSPCIDAGTDLGATYDDGLYIGSSWPDSVNTKDQDRFDAVAGGGIWEIGAYTHGQEFWEWGAPVTSKWSTWHLGSDAISKGNALWFTNTGANAWASSPVVDTGRAVNHIGYFGIGGELTVTKKIRGSTTSFAWDAGAPAWEAYSAGVNKTWRFIQVKIENPT